MGSSDSGPNVVLCGSGGGGGGEVSSSVVLAPAVDVGPLGMSGPIL